MRSHLDTESVCVLGGGGGMDIECMCFGVGGVNSMQQCVHINLPPPRFFFFLFFFQYHDNKKECT